MLLISLNPQFQSILLYDQPFLNYRLFWESALNNPTINVNTTRSKLRHVCHDYCSWSPNFSPFHYMTSHAQVIGHFKTSALNDTQKMPLNSTRSKYTIYALLTTVSLKFHSMTKFLWITPIWFWKLQGQITPYMSYYCPCIPNFSQFHFTTSHFWVSGDN